MEQLEQQLCEIELLSSMFPGDQEMLMDDVAVVNDVRRYIEGKREALPNQISFTIKLCLEDGERNESKLLKICCTFPLDYPNIPPEVFVKSDQLSRNQQKLINSDLQIFIKHDLYQGNEGELCITSIVTWLQERGLTYFQESFKELPSCNEETSTYSKKKVKYTGLSRLWIYSHHIYRKELLKKIPEIAEELGLTGFCLPGKPGIICVEGCKEDCDEYWQRLKYPNWKHISCKHREDSDLDITQPLHPQMTSFQLFDKFEELAFEAHGDYGLRNDYHMDLGKFWDYLKAHKCDYMFNIFFGLDGKSATDR